MNTASQPRMDTKRWSVQAFKRSK